MSGVDAAGVAERITRDRMAHYGYTVEEIAAAETMTHPAAGCHYEHPYGWVCTDEDDKPLHPDLDELNETAEFVMWVLEHPALAAAPATPTPPAPPSADTADTGRRP